MSIEKIEAVLRRMAELLRIGSLDDWANLLDSFRREVRNDPRGAFTSILSVYGGMGSLNDLVLYKNGQPLVVENIEFDELRSKLFLMIRLESESGEV